MRHLSRHLMASISKWLVKEGPPPSSPLCDFNRLCYELRPGDVLLVEGRSRIGEVIKSITQSTWTHSALYIGRLFDINDPVLQAREQPARSAAIADMIGRFLHLTTKKTASAYPPLEHEEFAQVSPKSAGGPDA